MVVERKSVMQSGSSLTVRTGVDESRSTVLSCRYWVLISVKCGELCRDPYALAIHLTPEPDWSLALSNQRRRVLYSCLTFVGSFSCSIASAAVHDCSATMRSSSLFHTALWRSINTLLTRGLKPKRRRKLHELKRAILLNNNSCQFNGSSLVFFHAFSGLLRWNSHCFDVTAVHVRSNNCSPYCERAPPVPSQLPRPFLIDRRLPWLLKQLNKRHTLIGCSRPFP